MNQIYPETLRFLRQREADLEKALRLNREAQDILEKNDSVLFQVHIQQDWPNRRPIMDESENLEETVEKVRNLFLQWRGKHRMDCEVFLRKNGIRIALSGEDVAMILGRGEQASYFQLDRRVEQSSRVFLDGEKLPSSWYANEPTPPKIRELAKV